MHAAMLAHTMLNSGLRRCLLVHLVQVAATMQEKVQLHACFVPPAFMAQVLVPLVSLLAALPVLPEQLVLIQVKEMLVRV